jgi:hypothetical protein
MRRIWWGRLDTVGVFTGVGILWIVGNLAWHGGQCCRREDVLTVN